MITCTGFIIK